MSIFSNVIETLTNFTSLSALTTGGIRSYVVCHRRSSCIMSNCLQMYVSIFNLSAAHVGLNNGEESARYQMATFLYRPSAKNKLVMPHWYYTQYCIINLINWPPTCIQSLGGMFEYKPTYAYATGTVDNNCATIFSKTLNILRRRHGISIGALNMNNHISKEFK